MTQLEQTETVTRRKLCTEKNMASNQSSLPSTNNSHFDELRWLVHVRHAFAQMLEEEDTSVPVAIFDVPKSLLSTNPEAYVPQLFALGPYHKGRPELYDMERYKIASAQRTAKALRDLRFELIVDCFIELEHKIRAPYHRYLDYNGETLAWMMAIDVCFLLEFLQNHHGDKEVKAVGNGFSKVNWVNNAIVRDIMMLENQVPLFLLGKILEFQCSSTQVADEVLSEILESFMKEVSPFKMVGNIVDITQHVHLLQLLYHMVVPKCKGQIESIEVVIRDDESKRNDQKFENYGKVKRVFVTLWNNVSGLNCVPIRYVKQVLTSRPIKLFVQLPWKVLSKLPVLSVFTNFVEQFFSSQTNADSKSEELNSTTNINKPPLIEEIIIPSVTELVDAGVKFARTHEGINGVSFDMKSGIFYLPTVTLDINTEVVLRNLVAYEASGIFGPLVFTRYTELMNGIIDTEEDVKLLRQSGIISNRMKSDKEVSDIWNGMSKSVRLTRVPKLDRVIEDVNKYYNKNWRIKTSKLMKKYVFNSWKFLTLLAAILLLLMTAFQAFCSVLCLQSLVW
ncbi:putative UPF0481 protein At3g02645 [Phoenix dactylifera]|uniref:UPF0481 protein At3g02645 n=1 Tax=Phoenix dactylifera TaxID=42345 RepID=A0A8B9ANT5_PHODC|nr:putative UPF0481 protein At3g02645 [Phoenix dactylifera]